MAAIGPVKTKDRFNIICAHPTPGNFPLSLGMILAYAREKLPGEVYDFGPRLVRTPQELEAKLSTESTNLLVCSNYFWSVDFNLSLSGIAKKLDPECITIHGGPSVPGYPDANEHFMASHREVDYAVLGEGEIIFAELLRALTENDPMEHLTHNVVAMRNDKPVRLPGRVPCPDLDEFPSPYLSGMFDDMADEFHLATVESNRGCPYGCVYCSWDDPNNPSYRHKLRKYDMDRVRGEIEWVASRGIDELFVGDSNFGIFPRDVQIAGFIADAKRKHGFPTQVYVTHAKNTTKHIVQVVETLEDAGINSDGGVLGIQTRDPETLKVIKRHNIKSSEFDNLKEELKKRGFPIAIHLMLGLPGATPDAFMNDLRYHFDEPVEIIAFRTMMLPNSPMAHPDFRKEHKIELDPNNLILSTATMTRDDLKRMETLGCIFDAVQNLGVLRLPMLYLTWERNMDAVSIIHDFIEDQSTVGWFPDFYKNLPTPEEIRASLPSTQVEAMSENLISTLTATLLQHHFFRSKKNRKAYGWTSLNRDFMDWAKTTYSLPDDPAMDALIEAQTALMPAGNETFPRRIKLDHDVVRWYWDHKAGGNKPLRDYGPGVLDVREPCFFWERWVRKNIAGLRNQTSDAAYVD